MNSNIHESSTVEIDVNTLKVKFAAGYASETPF